MIPDSPRYLALLCVLASSSAASATAAAVAVLSDMCGSGYLTVYTNKVCMQQQYVMQESVTKHMTRFIEER